METNLLLESHLKTLRLATFREQYRQVAEDAAGNNLGYDQYLLALAEQEVAQRHLNSQRQRIKAARQGDLTARGIRLHIANSAVAIGHSGHSADMVRCGIALYGVFSNTLMEARKVSPTMDAYYDQGTAASSQPK